VNVYKLTGCHNSNQNTNKYSAVSVIRMSYWKKFKRHQRHEQLD